MAKFFKTRIVGAAKVKLDLMNLIPGARDRIRTVITQKASQIANLARNKLSGGVLKSRSGYLRRSIKTKLDETKTKVTARVYSNAPHAHLWEQGWGGKAISVKAHVRKVKRGTKVGIVKTKQLKNRTNIKFGQTAQGIAFVKAHERNVPRQHRPFLKASLDEVRNDVYLSVRAALYSLNKTI